MGNCRAIRQPTRFGATYAQMTPGTFLARLCTLVPPPGVHTVRYYGVLVGHHALRRINGALFDEFRLTAPDEGGGVPTHTTV